MGCAVPLRSVTVIDLPCKSIRWAPALAPIVKVFNGVTFVVARTTQKKLAPETGADANVILSSTIVKEVIASWTTPPRDTNNVYGLIAKKGSPPTFNENCVVLLLNCELISSSLIKHQMIVDDQYMPSKF